MANYHGIYHYGNCGRVHRQPYRPVVQRTLATSPGMHQQCGHAHHVLRHHARHEAALPPPHVAVVAGHRAQHRQLYIHLSRVEMARGGFHHGLRPTAGLPAAWHTHSQLVQRTNAATRHLDDRAHLRPHASTYRLVHAQPGHGEPNHARRHRPYRTHLRLAILPPPAPTSLKHPPRRSTATRKQSSH